MGIILPPKVRKPWLTSLMLAFCVANLLWSLGGTWEISPQERHAGSMRQSGRFLCANEERHLLLLLDWNQPLAIGGRLGGPPLTPRDVGLAIGCQFAWSTEYGFAPEGWHYYYLNVSSHKRGIRPGMGIVISNHFDRVRGNSARGIAIHWLWLVALSAVPCGVRWRRFLTLRSRAKHGRCLRCGYDLRAATGDVCPECGTTRITAATPAS